MVYIYIYRKRERDNITKYGLKVDSFIVGCRTLSLRRSHFFDTNLVNFALTPLFHNKTTPQAHKKYKIGGEQTSV